MSAIDALADAQVDRESRRRLASLAWRIRRAMSRNVRVLLVVSVAGETQRHTGYIVEAGRRDDRHYVVLCEKPTAIDRGAEIWRGDLGEIASIERPAA